VPRSLAEDGHETLSLTPEADQGKIHGMKTIYRLQIRRA